MSLHTVIQAFQHTGEVERSAGCFSFIVSPSKPISYKLFPYLSCHVQLPRKTAGKQSVNSKQPISPEQCAIPRRERDKGEEGLGEGGKEQEGRQRSCCDAAKGPGEKRKEKLLKVTEGKSCELCNCKYATGRLPTISKDLRFQNRRGGLTDLRSGSGASRNTYTCLRARNCPIFL